MNCTAAFEITQRLDMDAFANYDVDGFRRLHHPDAVAILPSGRVVRGIDSIIDALAEHFAHREAVYTWRELHRFVDGCRSAFVLYETAYEIPSSGYQRRALTGVSYIHEGGRWLAIADQASLIRA
ncbi:MAG TPA: nuclear transport factor 2 family protein [Candidatus Limnocylindrales bacterium]|nr:nuclear transport factor 2 family protein [Candidatus Limnocylindrales bacterium]